MGLRCAFDRRAFCTTARCSLGAAAGNDRPRGGRSALLEVGGRQDPANRKLNAGIIRVFNRLVLGLKLRDVDCAFKVYRKEVLDSIDLLCDGILIDTEIFYKAKRQGYTFKEVPVTHYPRAGGTPTGSRPDVLARVVREIPNLLKSRGKRTSRV